MIASARPARFGQGERTLTDLSVRDTWEITPDQMTLTGLDWDAILAGVRDELGLPARARLRVEPHALLVSGKGYFCQFPQFRAGEAIVRHRPRPWQGHDASIIKQ